ncbi:LuxR C-terminal-related transcriptional regulator [Brachybacterium sp. AOP25-B2-12]|uniref:LuxR C-terminal-related transcriptional regulator n=1 Tax=Brachybacterium sp. AOP25-B2-12 TaxID=3457710 RepID=UPI0040337545
MDDEATRQQVPTALAGTVLGLHLDERVEDFARLLGEAPLAGVRESSRTWLRERYAEIVPVVLPAALRAVEHGTPIDPEALAQLRGIARDCPELPATDPSVILRGGAPALTVFALVVQTAARQDVERAALAMGRASLVVLEMGSCWTEAWWRRRGARRTRPDDDAEAAPASAEDLDLIATGSGTAEGLEPSDEQMLELLAQGLSNEAISRRTAYSRQAVAWRLGRLMRTWNAPNRTALVAFAVAKGWLGPRGSRRAQGAGSGPTTDEPPTVA